VGNCVVEPDQLNSFRLFRPILPLTVFDAEDIIGRGKATEKERNRHVQNLGHIGEARSADPIGSTLVFLHLLEGQPDSLGEAVLVHPEQQPSHADALADMDVNWVRYAGAASERRPGTSHFGSSQRRPLFPQKSNYSGFAHLIDTTARSGSTNRLRLKVCHMLEWRRTSRSSCQTSKPPVTPGRTFRRCAASMAASSSSCSMLCSARTLSP